MAKKILLYTDTPIAGGAEKHMQLLAKNLLKDRYEAKIVCSSYPSLSGWCDSMEKDAIPVIRLEVKHKHDPRHLSLLKNLIETEKPDILHLHLWNPGACRYAFFAAKKTKIIATEHDPFPLSGLKKILKKITLHKTTHTIVVSHDNEEKMLSWYPQLSEKISVIHNGIDLKNFEKSLVSFAKQEKTKIRTQLFEAKAEDNVILSIAALHPRKGLMHLLEAFALIHAKNPHTKLIIVGEGPEKKHLDNKIKKLKLEKEVKILSHQTEIPKILKSSDLFVLPSIKEAFGLVLLEAMAAEIPIVTSKIGGIPEIIEDRKNGLLVEPGNSKLLAEKILELIENKALGEKLTFLGSHEVQNFSIEKMVKKTEEVYDRILLK